MSELRYHPFLDQWVITATHRQDRTFLPPADLNPLAPTKPGTFPTEIPLESYDIVVFENKFPSLQTPASKPVIDSTALIPVRPSEGKCEVICYSQDPEKTFATLPFGQVRKLTRVWKDRFVQLGNLEEIEYVFIFENKGKEIGVTLTHPHGQIYGYPFIPPIPLQELRQEKLYFDKNSVPMMSAIIEEAHANHRIIWENCEFVAFVPSFARYPFEVYVTCKKHLSSMAKMSSSQLDELAEILLVVTKKYDGIFGFSFPYIMSMHQEPSIAGYNFAWFHVEFYPPYRAANKLKYLAGSEAGAGAFINDTLPEESAATLRDIDVKLE